MNPSGYRRVWSTEEISVLTEHYATTDFQTITRLLPNRTRKAIWRRAEQLGLKRQKRTRTDVKAWSPEEIRILKENYHKTRAELLALLPFRSWVAIRYVARRHHLTRITERTKVPLWTNVEVLMLKQHFQKSTKYEIMKAIPSRTWCAIISKAQDLAIKREVMPIDFGEVKSLNLNECQKGYIAAIVDGEGCISLKKGRTRVAISNTDYALVQSIQNELGIGRLYGPKRKKGRQIYTLEICSNSDLLAFLDAVSPYFRHSIKRVKAELLREYLLVRRNTKQMIIYDYEAKVIRGARFIRDPREDEILKSFKGLK